MDRRALPPGPLFCVIAGPTRGRAWSATAVRAELRHLVAEAGVWRRFAPHQYADMCESMIGTVRAIQRNVKNWSSGEMCLRWTAAGMLEAESRFRKVEGYRSLAQLAIHIETVLIKRRHQLKTS